jgi:hypothetical protein
LVIHTVGSVKADLIIDRDTEFDGSRFARQRRLCAGSVDVWVISPEDLILSKLDWARDSVRKAVQRRSARVQES